MSSGVNQSTDRRTLKEVVLEELITIKTEQRAPAYQGFSTSRDSGVGAIVAKNDVERSANKQLIG
mgnify:CR=1 FL=1